MREKTGKRTESSDNPERQEVISYRKEIREKKKKEYVIAPNCHVLRDVDDHED